MKKIILSSIIIVIILFAVGILLISQNPGKYIVGPGSNDPCSKKTIHKTNCCTISQFFTGAEYDPETNTCKQVGGDCCAEFPFKDLEECQNTCISKQENIK